MRGKGAGILPLFVVLNFCFAVLNLFGFLAFGVLVCRQSSIDGLHKPETQARRAVTASTTRQSKIDGILVVIGVFFSENNEEGRVEGVTFCLLIMVLFLVCFLVYLIAAIGLLRKSVWGYYCHLVGAALFAVSCLGLVYTIPAFICAFQPGFQEEFFPSRRRDSVEVEDEY